MRFEDWIPHPAGELTETELAALITNEELAESLTPDELAPLLTAQDLLAVLTDGQLSALLDVPSAQRLIRAELEPPRGAASKWVAEQSGVASRTARRWLGPNPPASRTGQVVDLAMQVASLDTRLQIADTAPPELRHALAVEAPAETRRSAAGHASTPTRAAVAARTRSTEARAAAALRGRSGHANVGRCGVVYDGRDEGVRFIGVVDIDLATTLTALHEGNRDDAADAFGAEVLEAYGPGLSLTLEITDYLDGIHLT